MDWLQILENYVAELFVALTLLLLGSLWKKLPWGKIQSLNFGNILVIETAVLIIIIVLAWINKPDKPVDPTDPIRLGVRVRSCKEDCKDNPALLSKTIHQCYVKAENPSKRVGLFNFDFAKWRASKQQRNFDYERWKMSEKLSNLSESNDYFEWCLDQKGITIEKCTIGQDRCISPSEEKK